MGWARSRRRSRAALASFGAEIRTNAPVERILVRDGRAVGVALADGTEFKADLVVAATHPQITFLRQLDRRDLPADFVEDIERWKSRSGTVKINVAIEGLPKFTSAPDLAPENYTGVLELCDSLEYVEKAFQDARSGKAAEQPFSDTVIPSTVDRTLCPEGTNIMSMFTQWVPHTWSDRPAPGGAQRLRRPGHRRSTTGWRPASSSRSSTAR